MTRLLKIVISLFILLVLIPPALLAGSCWLLNAAVKAKWTGRLFNFMDHGPWVQTIFGWTDCLEVWVFQPPKRMSSSNIRESIVEDGNHNFDWELTNDYTQYPQGWKQIHR